MPMVRCPIDGTVFRVSPYRLAHTKRAPTCSPACRRASMRGEHHWNYKGGAYVDADGYRRVRQPDGSYVREHRLVAAKRLKRRLRPNEIVRHNDGDRLNNRPSNLTVVRIRAAR